MYVRVHACSLALINWSIDDRNDRGTERRGEKERDRERERERRRERERL